VLLLLLLLLPRVCRVYRHVNKLHFVW